MRRTLFVISDLHLGGPPASNESPDLQMCTSDAQQRLASFIRYAAAQHNADRDVRLVINGDIVDFLAEKDAKPFIKDDALATKVLEIILQRTDEVWQALREFTASGAALTLILGNHDIELSLPGPRRLLLSRLGRGRVEFIYDNQAFVDGPVLIEHGNRYDVWNMIPHNRLRQVRSRLSRGETPGHCPDVPGSVLVCDVINDLKKTYRFVDLLKPETDAVLPVLPVLDATLSGLLEQVVNGIKGAWPFLRSRRVRTDSKGRPKDDEYVSSAGPPTKRQRRLEKALRLAMDWEGIVDPDEAGFTEVAFTGLRELWDSAQAEIRKRLIAKLRQKWRYTSQRLRWAFDVTREDATWLKPVGRSAALGFKVIIYGHTHLAKQVSGLPEVNGLPRGCLYLNTGTWTDLMRVPQEILAAVPTAGEDTSASKLETFLDDLLHNRLDSWRKLIPTYARCDLEQEGSQVQLHYAGVKMFLSDREPDHPLPHLLME
jgi:UDP-2,3-diacylglucosamine pyrophosphatase LpxH